MPEARERIRPLSDKYGKEMMASIAEEMVQIDEKTDPPTARLKDETRRLCHQLLGPDPAKQTPAIAADSAPKHESPIDDGPVEPPSVKQTRTSRSKSKVEPKRATAPRRGEKEVPIMTQYREAKERHPRMILLFRIGDFYEVFDDEAEECHKLLGLTLTTRGGEATMAGFPHHQLEKYLHRLLKEGKRVAVCDQVEEGKAPVKREVTRVVTQGSIVEKAKPVKQPRHFVLKKYEEHLNAKGLAFVSIDDVKKTTPAVAPHMAGLDFIVLRGDDKLLVTVRPNLPAKNADAAKEVQKLFGSPYRSIRIWPSAAGNAWKWDEFPIVTTPDDGGPADEPA